MMNYTTDELQNFMGKYDPQTDPSRRKKKKKKGRDDDCNCDDDNKNNNNNDSQKTKEDAHQPKNMTRSSQAHLEKMVSGLDAYIKESLKTGPVVGSLDTLVDPEERKQAMSNSALLRVSKLLEMAHATNDVIMAPSGDDLQKVLFIAATRPPFKPCHSSHTNVPISLNVFVTIMTQFLALSPAGIVRLPTAPFFLLTAEWLVDYARSGALALVLEQKHTEKSTFPQGGIVTLNSLSAAERKTEQFCYAGFVYVDQSLVSAAAGTPEFLPL